MHTITGWRFLRNPYSLSRFCIYITHIIPCSAKQPANAFYVMPNRFLFHSRDFSPVSLQSGWEALHRAISNQARANWRFRQWRTRTPIVATSLKYQMNSRSRLPTWSTTHAQPAPCVACLHQLTGIWFAYQWLTQSHCPIRRRNCTAPGHLAILNSFDSKLYLAGANGLN